MESERATHNIDAIYSKDSKILILGSFPSRKSRELQFFYSHPSNRFWKILEALFSTELQTIQDKKEFLLSHDIALWDVIKQCEIKGSSDSSIENAIPNDISSLLDCSNIKAIFLNGKKAEEIFKRYNSVKVPVTTLPSTSAQNASYSFYSLLSSWKAIKEALEN